MCDIQKLKLGFHACDNQDVAVTILQDRTRLDICSVCWAKLAEHDKWGGEIKISESVPKPLFGLR